MACGSTSSRARMRKLTTFEGSEVTLKAAYSTWILRRGAAVFASSSSSGYPNQSFVAEDVDGLSAFISHNWSVHRIFKFLALSLQYNYKFAVGLSMLWAAGTVIFILLGPDPGLVASSFHRNASWYCRLTFPPVFFFALFFGGDLRGMLGFRGSTVFVDKLCICQTDQDIKRQSVERLAAFIKCSESMLVLYTDVYLQRVWTIYEVASFLLINKVSNMTVLPVSKAALRTAIMLYAGFSHIIAIFFGSVGLRKVITIPTLVVAILYVSAIRRWERDRQAMSTRLEHFTIRDCECAVEGDRQLVYDNISTLLKATKKVHEGAKEAEALYLFDSLVRRKLPHVFATAHFQFVFAYHEYLMLGFLTFGVQLVDAVVWLRHDTVPWEVFCATAMLVFVRITFVQPSALMLMEWLASCNPAWRGCREVLWVGFCMSAYIPAPLWVWVVERSLSTPVLDNKIYMVLCGVGGCVLGLVTWWMFHAVQRGWYIWTRPENKFEKDSQLEEGLETSADGLVSPPKDDEVIDQQSLRTASLQSPMETIYERQDMEDERSIDVEIGTIGLFHC